MAEYLFSQTGEIRRFENYDERTKFLAGRPDINDWNYAGTQNEVLRQIDLFNRRHPGAPIDIGTLQFDQPIVTAPNPVAVQRHQEAQATGFKAVPRTDLEPAIPPMSAPSTVPAQLKAIEAEKQSPQTVGGPAPTPSPTPPPTIPGKPLASGSPQTGPRKHLAPRSPQTPPIAPLTARYTDLANVNGTIYNSVTGKGYATPAELARDLGINPHEIDWTKIKPSAQPPQPPSPPPSKAPTVTGGPAPEKPTAPAIGEGQVTQPVQDPFASIKEVFGPTWQPAPAFTPELQQKGIYGAVRISGQNEVYTLGPGGSLETPESFQNKFGTLEQKGIVGEISVAQARKLGIMVKDNGDPLQTTQEDLQTDPFRGFVNLYKELYGELGLDTLKERISEIEKELLNIDETYAEDIEDINENPWISEGLRTKKIKAASEKYEARRNAVGERFKLYQGLFETGTRQVEFISGKYLEQHNKERAFGIDELKFLAEQARKEADLDTQIIESGGRKWLIDLDTGNKIADLGSAPGPKPTTADKETALINSIESRLVTSRGSDGFADPNIYLGERVKATFGPDQFDKRFGHFLSPREQKRLGIASAAPIPPERFLGADWLRNSFPHDVLYKKALEAGKSKGLFGKEETVVNEYLTDIMKTIEQYRNAGFTDNEILKLMK